MIDVEGVSDYVFWRRRRRRRSVEVDCGRKNKTSVKRECYTGSHS